MPKNIGGRGYRPSAHINRRVTQAIFRAFDFATARGTPFNRYVVIHLHERPDAVAATLFEEIRHKFRDWMNYATRNQVSGPARPIYAYTLECPDGAAHVNWVIHVPPALLAAFERKLEQWVRKVQGNVGPHDINVQPITGNAKSLAKYLVKGTDPYFIDHFYLGSVHKPQGEVFGKRAGFSPALGPAARLKARFNAKKRRFEAAPTSPATVVPAAVATVIDIREHRPPNVTPAAEPQPRRA